MTRNRIWGNIIGDNHRSGYKELKRSAYKARSLLTRYEQSATLLHDMYPFFKKWDRLNYRKEKYSERKLRVFARGVKVGQRKGGAKTQDAMSVFETARKPSKSELGQKLGEASFSDDSLGISSSEKEFEK